MRRWLAGVALGSILAALWPVGAMAAPAVVSAIFARSHEGRLLLEIVSSEPLDYIVIEEATPWSVSLLFLNATFGFPVEDRAFPGPGLTRIRTAVLEREGSRLGRLDLSFVPSAAYRVVREGARLLVQVETPPGPQGLVLGAAVRETSPRTAAPARREPPPASIPLIMGLRPETVGEEVRVVVEADGPLPHRSFAAEKPARIVVDLDRAQLSQAEEILEVDHPLLKRIRLTQRGPAAVRVVLDLARPQPYWIESQPEGVVIHLGRARRP